ncbi:MAG: hypothetical protein N3B18_01165, partial [Desulfobacterota bacterium]|nr:hypothetical protein [Thermodesulfobacteriota bacterium]
DAAVTALHKAGIAVELKEVIAVLIPDSPGGFDRLVQCLAQHGINIENAYGFVIESRKHAVIVLDVKQPDTVRELLAKEKFETISGAALAAIEPFHYMQY